MSARVVDVHGVRHVVGGTVANVGRAVNDEAAKRELPGMDDDDRRDRHQSRHLVGLVQVDGGRWCANGEGGVRGGVSQPTHLQAGKRGRCP